MKKHIQDLEAALELAFEALRKIQKNQKSKPQKNLSGRIKQKRNPPAYSLREYGLRNGHILKLKQNPIITCKVHDVVLKTVIYEGQIMTVSKAANVALKSLGYRQNTSHGFSDWTFGGKTLQERRQ